MPYRSFEDGRVPEMARVKKPICARSLIVTLANRASCPRKRDGTFAYSAARSIGGLRSSRDFNGRDIEPVDCHFAHQIWFSPAPAHRAQRVPAISRPRAPSAGQVSGRTHAPAEAVIVQQSPVAQLTCAPLASVRAALRRIAGRAAVANCNANEETSKQMVSRSN